MQLTVAVYSCMHVRLCGWATSRWYVSCRVVNMFWRFMIGYSACSQLMNILTGESDGRDIRICTWCLWKDVLKCFESMCKHCSFHMMDPVMSHWLINNSFCDVYIAYYSTPRYSLRQSIAELLTAHINSSHEWHTTSDNVEACNYTNLQLSVNLSAYDVQLSYRIDVPSSSCHHDLPFVLNNWSAAVDTRSFLWTARNVS